MYMELQAFKKEDKKGSMDRTTHGLSSLILLEGRVYSMLEMKLTDY